MTEKDRKIPKKTDLEPALLGAESLILLTLDLTSLGEMRLELEAFLVTSLFVTSFTTSFFRPETNN